MVVRAMEMKYPPGVESEGILEPGRRGGYGSRHATDYLYLTPLARQVLVKSWRCPLSGDSGDGAPLRPPGSTSCLAQDYLPVSPEGKCVQSSGFTKRSPVFFKGGTP